ncbi:MAG TPA: hypothetical protein VND98_00900 [Solirubrobacterales bacterium]|nr:hypothetical protein [Solirubrobacterales bacterium]
MESVVSPVDHRRQVVLLRVSGFTSLALGLVGSIACIALAVVAIANVLGGFQTVDVPGRGVLTLEQRHYVIYYEDTVSMPEAVELRGLRVSIRPAAGPQNVLPISGYEGSFTYSRGSYYGRAVGTFNTPQPGRYLINTLNPYVAGESARIAVGPPVLGLLGRYLLRGILGAIVVFFGVGGVGALLLTLSDRREMLGRGALPQA